MKHLAKLKQHQLRHSFKIPRQPVFIAFEGGDGAGKTTQLKMLASALRRMDYQVLSTREPGGTKLGTDLRKMILHSSHDIDSKCEALLYAADRANHVAKVIRPALQEGKIVLTDRYIDSSIAYQGYGRQLGKEQIEELNMWATDNLKPTLTVVLDVDPAKTMLVGQKDNIESLPLEFHQQVRQLFLDQAKAHPDNYLVLTARADREQIHQNILQAVTQLL